MTMNSDRRNDLYSAVLLHHDSGEDLGPVSVDGARSEGHAIELAKAGARKRVQEDGLGKAFVQVLRNAHSLGRFEVIG
jgi:hypothetical protein